MPKALTKTDTYKTLVSKITQELSELEFFIKRRTAEGYWNIGKYIHEHLLAHQKRAEYGVTLYERLAEDVERDKTTLMRATQFFLICPILARLGFASSKPGRKAGIELEPCCFSYQTNPKITYILLGKKP